ncbi:uncharacterized protein CMU_027450 [Cryptosporidium muris RN66]|uniref:Uncharacterized protein n=1 Tax=Cryptosporidium muris (strain RN66) TaxID=441375 RepID=B6ABI3_CRYMR|nr:uncharacterized protein CMU_027450 [Cryptosporidium muris RN66]EEA05735.1 hypothetical protein CMU_027450 [Cryptosporidium muris RN66]|eukprot:XP_002140084.1 hypothetical protein [Cryptosporidium muris RN66]
MSFCYYTNNCCCHKCYNYCKCHIVGHWLPNFNQIYQIKNPCISEFTDEVKFQDNKTICNNCTCDPKKQHLNICFSPCIDSGNFEHYNQHHCNSCIHYQCENIENKNNNEYKAHYLANNSDTLNLNFNGKLPNSLSISVDSKGIVTLGVSNNIEDNNKD